MKIRLLTFHLLIVLSSCYRNPFDCDTSIDDKQLTEEFGSPTTKMVVVTKNSTLYEYQNRLLEVYKNIKVEDTILVVEKRWDKNHFHLVRWYDQKSVSRPIDCVIWDDQE